MPSWDVDAYARFTDERARPFDDLLARVGATAPAAVADLGCGTGELTVRLARRWPDADVVGVDSSPAMVARAREVSAGVPRVAIEHGDVRAWAPPGPVDVLVSNAVLQWVPGHDALLRRWVGLLAPGGWLAVQVPANLDAPSHALMREVAADGPWAARLSGVLRTQAVRGLDEYARLLLDAGCAVDAWETTYLHVLDPEGRHGDDAVLAWVSGTGLRPVLDALADDPELRDRYLAAYGAALRAAYPRGPAGTLLAFRRRFVVARPAASRIAPSGSPAGS